MFMIFKVDLSFFLQHTFLFSFDFGVKFELDAVFLWVVVFVRAYCISQNLWGEGGSVFNEINYLLVKFLTICMKLGL